MTLLTELVILGLFAMSLDLMVGYTRLVSFGHAAAYGIGAYASGYMLLNSSMPLLFVVLSRRADDRRSSPSASAGCARLRPASRSRC